MMQSLELELAGRYVHEYDEVMRKHSAKDSDECNDCLAQGIVAYRWIVRAEEVIRTAADCGFVEFSDELRSRFADLYREWLESGERSETLIAGLQSNGSSSDHLVEFRSCCDEARAWFDRNDWLQRSRTARNRRFAEEPW